MFNWKTLASGVAVSAIAASVVQVAEAQVTTSAMRGEITSDTGAPVSGATVVVRHTPSGTVSTATTNASGIFSARNLRVGGPYTVEITGGDFTPVEVNDIFLGLDETFPLAVTVSGERTLEAVVVTASQVASGYLDTGLSSTFGLEELGEVVSIDRDITDIAQLDPFASVNVQSGGAKELSIAGANNRFNTLTIDGIALNDRFGLNANGFPTQRSPISFDAIESLSIESAPYDTEFNGFTGGTINAVTKSGTNEFHGSAYYFTTNDTMAGDEIRDRKVDRDFDEETIGFTLGGPILKDRLFFFASYDKFEETATLNRGPIGSGAVNIENVTEADVATISQISRDVYGFDPLDFGSVPPVEDEKILGSLDWNITNDHRAKFTYIRTEGSSIREQNGNNFVQFSPVAFPSSWYNRSETIESYIGHVFSDWTPNFSTEFKLAQTTQETGQDSLNGAEFPLISVATSTGTAISLGPDRFRHGNELDQEFLQLKAKAEYVWGDHIFKVGFEREEVDVDNLFAQNSEGTYAFTSIDNFRDGIVDEVTYDNAITNDENDLRAIWGYNYNSIYVQDTWDVLSNLSLLYGIRYDYYESEGTIRENPNFVGRYGFTNTTDIDGLDIVLPRFGFNYDFNEDITIRGGIGRFSGGSPNVWVSNSYSNDGVTNDGVSAEGVIFPFTPDAATGQFIPPELLTELSTTEPDGSVAALAPDFEIPTTWKLNLGAAWNVDIGPSRDWLLSADVLYNKLENQPFWFDASCGDPVSVSPDGRPVYNCSGAPEATVVGSTDKGHSTLIAVSAQKEWDNGLDLFFSYTNADVNDIGYGTSSTATSNYSDSARFSYQNPRTGTSNFQTEHLFKLRLGWEKEFVKDYPTSVSMFAERRSGQPYSYTFNTNSRARTDVFGIRESRADDAGALFYVPSGPTDPLFSAQSFGGDAETQAAFFDYIENSELAQYQGSIAPRNGDNSRWSTIIDLRFEQEFPGLRDADRTFLFVDIENVGNLLNPDWGVIERVEYEYIRQVAAAEIIDGQYAYGSPGQDGIFNTGDRGESTFSTDDNLEVLNQSLWQIQLGFKYEF
ncbi:MAG: TonB-dependent receptor [Pseudomonadota bacterium]